MANVKNVISFILIVFIFSCNSPTDNNSSLKISLGKYMFEDPKYCHIMTFSENNNVEELTIEGDISSECTTSIVTGTYDIDNSTYNLYCQSYKLRDYCDLPWDDYDYISGISYPIRNISKNSFELQVDVFWYK